MFVFPVAPPQSTAIPKTELLDRLGTHLTRHIGPGVEYADIRPVRARRPVAHRQLAGERAARQPARHAAVDRPRSRCGGADRHVRRSRRGPATEATERAMRGAVQVVQSALRSGDRAGDRHARRRSAALARRRHRPQAVLPSARHAARGRRRIRNDHGHIGAPRRASARRDRRRILHDAGHRVRAVADRPAQARAHRRRCRCPRRARRSGETYDPLFTRMWAMQRSFMYRDMATIGVDVVSWLSENTLDQSMKMVPERRRPVRGRR